MSKTAREIAEQIVYRPDPHTATARLIEAAILEAVKAEREACARIARITAEERAHLDRWTCACVLIEQRIRDRGRRSHARRSEAER